MLHWILEGNIVLGGRGLSVSNILVVLLRLLTVSSSSEYILHIWIDL